MSLQKFLKMGAAISAMATAPVVSGFVPRARKSSVESGAIVKDSYGRRKKVKKYARGYNPTKRPHNIRGERLLLNHRK